MSGTRSDGGLRSSSSAFTSSASIPFPNDGDGPTISNPSINQVNTRPTIILPRPPFYKRNPILFGALVGITVFSIAALTVGAIVLGTAAAGPLGGAITGYVTGLGVTLTAGALTGTAAGYVALAAIGVLTVIATTLIGAAVKLRNWFRPAIKINPVKDIKDKTKNTLLTRFLRTQKAGTKVRKGTKINLKDWKGTTIQLTHSIQVGENSYYVMPGKGEGKINEGHDGAAKHATKLKLTSDETLNKSKKKWAVKKSSKQPEEDMRQELENTRLVAAETKANSFFKNTTSKRTITGFFMLFGEKFTLTKPAKQLEQLLKQAIAADKTGRFITDIKPENILNFSTKKGTESVVIDHRFSLPKEVAIENARKAAGVTPRYMPPEVAIGIEINPSKVMAFSIALSIAEKITPNVLGSRLTSDYFTGQEATLPYLSLKIEELMEYRKGNEEFIDLLRMMLAMDQENRIDLDTALTIVNDIRAGKNDEARAKMMTNGLQTVIDNEHESGWDIIKRIKINPDHDNLFEIS